MNLKDGLGPILISNQQIHQRVVQLGAQITHDYRDSDLVLVSILKGGVVFLTDLMREIKIPLTIDFMCVSSYGLASDNYGVVRITKDLDQSIESRDVIVVEDIIDTGLTLQYILKNLYTREPKSLEVCTLLDKSARRIADIKIKYKGFDIKDKYVVGYGLDYRQRKRNLPHIYELDESLLKS